MKRVQLLASGLIVIGPGATEMTAFCMINIFMEAEPHANPSCLVKEEMKY